MKNYLLLLCAFFIISCDKELLPSNFAETRELEEDICEKLAEDKNFKLFLEDYFLFLKITQEIIDKIEIDYPSYLVNNTLSNFDPVLLETYLSEYEGIGDIEKRLIDNGKIFKEKYFSGEFDIIELKNAIKNCTFIETAITLDTRGFLDCEDDCLSAYHTALEEAQDIMIHDGIWNSIEWSITGASVGGAIFGVPGIIIGGVSGLTFALFKTADYYHLAVGNADEQYEICLEWCDRDDLINGN